MEEKIYFVWMVSNGNPMPQIWHGNLTDGTGKSRLKNHQHYELKGKERDYDLDVLIRLYPYKVVKANAT